MTSVFAKQGVLFPEVPEDGCVGVKAYIDACRQIPVVFDSLGKAFSPVKSDMNGNINKIQKVYDTNPEKYKTFKAVLEDEILQNKTKDDKSVCVALVWLNRALQYVMSFLQQIVDDHNAGQKTENMVKMVQKSYSECLEPYHGWVTKKVFGVISHAVPYREKFLKTLADGNTSESFQDEVISDMALSLKNIEPNVKNIEALYDDLGLDRKIKA